MHLCFSNFDDLVFYSTAASPSASISIYIGSTLALRFAGQIDYNAFLLPFQLFDELAACKSFDDHEIWSVLILISDSVYHALTILRLNLY